MSRLKNFLITFFLCLSITSLSIPNTASAFSLSSFAFVFLSEYDITADIGDEFYLFAITSTGKKATWKSSDSKIASVNTYGKVIAKKSGTATITAKIKNAEASCKVTVNKTKITLNKTSVSVERGETYQLSATTSNGSPVTWKSSKKSIATIDEQGKITGIKPGETTITASANGTSVTCRFTVKTPTIKLDKMKIKLFRGQTAKLSATVSSGITPTFKTNKKSVAIVDANGTITAMKNGSATITATIDGVSKTCEVIVEKPLITLSSTELTLTKGSKKKLTATVSSGNQPIWSTSNASIVTINSNGELSALAKGKAYVYAAEDGTKVRCTIRVTE